MYIGSLMFLGLGLYKDVWGSGGVEACTCFSVVS